ncbi:MAG: sterol desaturase family protein [Bdellovibrionales bacterium]
MVGIVFRGVVILGLMYLVFWKWMRPKIQKYRVPNIRNSKANPFGEMRATGLTYLVFGFFSAILVCLDEWYGYSKMYTDVNEMGWAYTLISAPLFIFFIDATFYWSHILMHRSPFFWKAHEKHHTFINVTPWAAYAFHLGEAVINAGLLFTMLVVFPWHPYAMLAFSLLTISYNGMLHSGFDFMPKSWRKHPILKFMNTPSHHIYHHQRGDCNFAFFFTFWDKWMGTERLPEYYYDSTLDSSEDLEKSVG